MQPKVLAAALRPQPQSPPPAYRPQPSPGVLQPKAAAGVTTPPTPQAKRPPAAPPVYRPEPKKIVQPKMASPQTPHPKAPPAYRPQPTPKVLQARRPAGLPPLAGRLAASGQQAHARTQTAGASAERPPTAPPGYRPDNSRPLQSKSALPAAPCAARPAPRPSRVLQPILKVGSDDKFETRRELKDWDYNGWLYRRIRRDYHNPGAVMGVFYRWAASSRKYRFDRWGEAIEAAQRDIRESKKKAKVSYRETTSPMREIEKKLYDKVSEHLEETRKKRKHDWIPTEKFLHGHIGECSQQLTLENSGIEYLDANALCMNMPGIDAVTTGQDKCFSQSKMHLCSRDPETYTSHVNRRTEYSKKLVKRMVGTTPSSKKARRGLKEFAEEKEHDRLTKIMKVTKKSKGESVEDLISYKDNTGLVNMVANQIYFPVPSDIYSQITVNQQQYFSPLDFDMRTLNKVKAQFDYKPTEERRKKTEEEEDPTFEL